MSHLASPARFLVSTERQGRVEHLIAVDPDRARAERCRDLMRRADITCPHSAGKSVPRAVRCSDHFFDSLELQCHHDRSENLLLHDLEVGLHVSEDRWLDEVALVTDALATSHRTCTLGKSAV